MKVLKSATEPSPILRLMRGTRVMHDGLLDLVTWADPPAGAIAVEVGSYAGESASIFASTRRFTRIVCVDVWNAPVTRLAERYYRVRASGWGLETLKLDSADAAATFPDGTLDFVYIDTWHTLDAVTRDIRAWLPKVRPGGVLAGHDYALGTPPEDIPDHDVEPHRFWPDVVKAVDQEFGKPAAVFCDTSWAVRAQLITEVER